MPGDAVRNKHYDAEEFWAARYADIDLTKSGHIDLPVAYNRWLYRRKKERLLQGLEQNFALEAETHAVIPFPRKLCL